ncbi:MAG: hypothetical protein Q8P02_01325 [Candidatus Micrarchaeota archaeon]|nr:hypothetical protein [Candidatus Micrarchaeota archaeon]
METVLACVIGSDHDALDVLRRSLFDFPAGRVALLCAAPFAPKAEKIKASLMRDRIAADLVLLDGLSFEDLFSAVARIRDAFAEKKLLLSVDTDNATSCIMLSAAFVNGVQAIGLVHGCMVAYPIMRFSYQNALSERKVRLLCFLVANNGADTLESISAALGMSLPLVTYHVHGTPEKPGLEKLGLVTTSKSKGRVRVTPTQLGRLIDQGHVPLPQDKRKKSR